MPSGLFPLCDLGKGEMFQRFPKPFVNPFRGWRDPGLDPAQSAQVMVCSGVWHSDLVDVFGAAEFWALILMRETGGYFPGGGS